MISCRICRGTAGKKKKAHVVGSCCVREFVRGNERAMEAKRRRKVLTTLKALSELRRGQQDPDHTCAAYVDILLHESLNPLTASTIVPLSNGCFLCTFSNTFVTLMSRCFET